MVQQVVSSQLAPTYKYDVLADAIYGRQLGIFHYQFNITNYEHVLASGTITNEYRAQVTAAIINEQRELDKDQAILAALVAQIDDQVAYDAAVVRAEAKRAAV
jgi:hypothetical protein